MGQAVGRIPHVDGLPVVLVLLLRPKFSFKSEWQAQRYCRLQGRMERATRGSSSTWYRSEFIKRQF